MTHDQIVGTVVISLVVGVFLIFLGAVLQPLFRRAWERMNAPSPLTPQTKGQLMASLVVWEAELERLTYLSTHPKELFLYLFQLCVAALLVSVLASLMCVVGFTLAPPAFTNLFLALALAALVLVGGFLATAMWEAGRMSDKKIDVTRKKVQKRIDDVNKLLNPPAP